MNDTNYAVIWGHNNRHELHVKLFETLGDAQDFTNELNKENYDVHNGGLPFNVVVAVLLHSDHRYSEGY